MCYLIRKGKEAGKKLIAEYIASKNTLNYDEWKEVFGNKGQKHFAEIYDKIPKEKTWLFAKNFP